MTQPIQDEGAKLVTSVSESIQDALYDDSEHMPMIDFGRWNKTVTKDFMSMTDFSRWNKTVIKDFIQTRM